MKVQRPGELVEFEVEGEDHWMKLKLKDGSILKFRTIITAVFRVGNDPNTGMPIYMVQSTNVIRLVSVPKELIKRHEAKANTYG
jgi:hypothetical protein